MNIDKIIDKHKHRVDTAVILTEARNDLSEGQRVRFVAKGDNAELDQIAAQCHVDGLIADHVCPPGVVGALEKAVAALVEQTFSAAISTMLARAAETKLVGVNQAAGVAK